MTLAALARFVAGEPDFDSQWRLVLEFLLTLLLVGLLPKHAQQAHA